MTNQVVLVETPDVYRRSPDYAGVLFSRTYPSKPSAPFFALRVSRPPWTFFENPFVSVYPVLEAFSPAAIQPPIGNFFAAIRPARRQLAEEPEEEYKRWNHSVYWQYVRLYAAQLVGYTFTVPDLCDHPWLEWVHPGASPESAIYPFRQINTFIRGQQFNLFFNQPKPWPVDAEEDTHSRLADYGVMLPWGRPAISLLMPNVIGLDQLTAASIIENLANLPAPTITWQSTTYPIPPVPYGIVVGQEPLPGAVLNPPFATLLIVSTGLMVLPDVGDSTNYSPVNVVIGDDTPP